MKKPLEEHERREYVRIANYYYRFGFTQEEIAKKMNMSRQRINRILSKCIELGIVKIVIPELEDTHMGIEAELEHKYGLQGVRVVDLISEEHLYSALGMVASQYLMSIIKPGDCVGFSRGRSVSALVEHVNPVDIEELTVVQLMGSWNDENSKVSSDDIVHRFSEKTAARPVMLHAPVVVKSEALRQSIMEEPFFIKKCNIAVMGIGDAKYQDLIPTIGEEEYDYMRNNAVGEICTHFFNEKGERVESPIANRIIAVEYEDLMKISVRMGVAGSSQKLAAIKGALAGKLINVLITDLKTAKTLL